MSDIALARDEMILGGGARIYGVKASSGIAVFAHRGMLRAVGPIVDGGCLSSPSTNVPGVALP